MTVVAVLADIIDIIVDAGGQGLLYVHVVELNQREITSTKSAGSLTEQGSATRSEPTGLMGITVTHWWVPFASALGQLGLGTVLVFSSTVRRNPGCFSHLVSGVSRRLRACPVLAVRKRMEAGED